MPAKGFFDFEKQKTGDLFKSPVLLIVECFLIVGFFNRFVKP